LHIRGADFERDVPLSQLSVSSGGWQGEALQLVWQDEGRAWALTVKDARPLAGLIATQLGQELTRAMAASLASRRRGRRAMVVLGLLGLLPLLLIVGLYLGRASILDAVTRRLPVSVDNEIGRLIELQVQQSGARIEQGPALDATRAIGQRLSAAGPDTPYAFRFELRRDAAVNAFAAPGGFIVVHSGLVAAAESEDELAGVLAHEMSHVIARHSLRQIVYQAGLTAGARLILGSPDGAAALLAGLATRLTTLHYSREQERAADAAAADLLVRAGYSPQGLILFFERLARESNAPPEFVSSHPAAEERAASLRRRGPAEAAPLAPSLGIDWTSVRADARRQGMTTPAGTPPGSDWH
jgi:Zn-dependent protease with chaperone function